MFQRANRFCFFSANKIHLNYNNLQIFGKYEDKLVSNKFPHKSDQQSDPRPGNRKCLKNLCIKPDNNFF